MTKCSATTVAGNRCQNSASGKSTRCGTHSKKLLSKNVNEKDWKEATAFIHTMVSKGLKGQKISPNEIALWKEAKITRAKFQHKILADMAPGDLAQIQKEQKQKFAQDFKAFK